MFPLNNNSIFNTIASTAQQSTFRLSEGVTPAVPRPQPCVINHQDEYYTIWQNWANDAPS